MAKFMSEKGSTGDPLAPAGVSNKEWQGWTALDFDEAASEDFYIAGRYGSAIGKALAVRINPTAKLCGQMVREAMKQEYRRTGAVKR